ncbi:MAG: hypothetical protein ABIH11_07500 [Candidatus Altiarchaeota archaeon]
MSLPTTVKTTSTTALRLTTTTSPGMDFTEYHRICVGQRCVKVKGRGESNCSVDAQCIIEVVSCNDTETSFSGDLYLYGKVFVVDEHGGEYEYRDYCMDVENLSEYWCDIQGLLHSINHTCGHGCEGGECLVD